MMSSYSLILVTLFYNIYNAAELTLRDTFYDTDVATAGVGDGAYTPVGSKFTATLSFPGITGNVDKAYLYWYKLVGTNTVPTDSITFDGNDITGENIGIASTNCWGNGFSQVFRAEITTFITGAAASYDIPNLAPNSWGGRKTSYNGFSLVVIYDDGNDSNNQDVVLYDGNDSNRLSIHDPAGWDIELTGINYPASGNAGLELHVSDGQHFADGDIVINGNSQPLTANGNVGNLFDIINFDVTSFMVPNAANTLEVTHSIQNDCLSTIVAIVTLPAGAAPKPNCDYNYAFVVDESGSVGPTNYVASIDFIIGLIQNNIKDSAQLMAVSYNTGRDWIYKFSEQQLPRNGPGSIIDELTKEKNDYDGGGTKTARALNDAISEFENEGFASNNVIILVTDGQSFDNVCTSYNIPARLVLKNIRVIVVGVGGFNPNGQLCLVNDPADIIDIDDFNFDPVVTQLKSGQVICDDEPQCYDTTDNNPCTPENLAANKYYFASCTSCCHFIQCNDWGIAYDMPTAAETMWDQAFAEVNPWNNGHIGNGQVHNDGSCTDSGTDGYGRPFQCTFNDAYVPTPQKSYFLGPDGTWDEGRAYCQQNGGDLASIHSQTVFDQLVTLCATQSSDCHIGLKYDYGVGKWFWSDGSPTDYGFDGNNDANCNNPPWKQYSSPCLSSDAAFSEECSIIDLTPSASSSLWDDHYCSAQNPPICYGIAPSAAHINSNNHIFDDNIKTNGAIMEHISNKNVKNNGHYYGYILLIGVIAFILINNIFIGCFCLRKRQNQQYAKCDLDMMGVNDTDNEI